MRAFLAIDLPVAVQAALREQQIAFRAALCESSPVAAQPRWTRPEGAHLTLKFLGEISSDRAGKVIQVLKGLGTVEKFPVEIKGFGFFPDAGRPRVVWAGVEAPPALGQLAKRLEDALEELGFAPETRPFNPHLTLARFKTSIPQPALQRLVEQKRDLSLGRFEVSEYFLFESKLSGGAPAEYRKVARFPQEGSIRNSSAI